jgi:hypothetical protein
VEVLKTTHALLEDKARSQDPARQKLLLNLELLILMGYQWDINGISMAVVSFWLAKLSNDVKCSGA